MENRIGYLEIYTVSHSITGSYDVARSHWYRRRSVSRPD